MADPLYAHEKLGQAVQTLATGPGRIKERLIDAVTSLVLVDNKVFDVEGIYRDAPEYWRKIWAALTAAESGPVDPAVGVAATSINRMTEEEASRIAQMIVSLDAMLGSYIEDQKPR